MICSTGWWTALAHLIKESLIFFYILSLKKNKKTEILAHFIKKSFFFNILSKQNIWENLFFLYFLKAEILAHFIKKSNFFSSYFLKREILIHFSRKSEKCSLQTKILVYLKLFHKNCFIFSPNRNND